MIRYFGISDVGCARPSNEDSFALEPDLGLFVVADGMGGAQAGELASRIAIETIVKAIGATSARSTECLVAAVEAANASILEQASGHPELRGMGTTVVAVLLEPPLAHIASVGDSRAYLFRAGSLRRITSDQTWVNEIGRNLGLTEEQIHAHPFRNVLTMAVGARENIDVRSHELHLEAGDLLLLSSDGLHGLVPDAEVAEALGSGVDLVAKATALINRARANGGPDNITAVLVENAA